MTARTVTGLGALSILVVVAAIYGGTLSYPFVYDDLPNITQNAGIRVGLDRSWGELRLWSPTRRPVSNASFALSFALGGYSVEGYRALNIALHAWTSLLVGLLAWLVVGRAAELSGVAGRAGWARRRAWLSVWSGLLFAAHPLATQPVVYVVQRMTVLSTLFYVAGLCAWIVGGRSSGRRGVLLRVSSLLLGLLSLGSKEIGATFPLALWLWEWGFVRDGDRDSLRRSVPWLLGVFGVGLVLLWAYSGGAPLRGYAEKPFTLWERCWTEPRVWWRYVGLVLAPLPGRLSLIHEVEMSSGPWSPWTTWVSWSSWGVLLWSSLRGWRGHRWWSALVVWWLLQQVVEGTVLPLEPMYEHRTYLPLVGWSVLLPWGAWHWVSGSSWGSRIPGAERVLLAVGVVWVLVLGWGAQERSRVWQDPLTLWTDARDKAPGHPTPLANQGVALIQIGRFDEARSALRGALAIDPRSHTALQNLGALDVGAGRFDSAEPLLRRAVEIQPLDGLAWAGLGAVAMEQGRPEDAIAYHRRALAITGDPRVRTNLGQILLMTGEAEAARHELTRSLALDPDQPVAWRKLGEAALELGRFEEAIAALVQARGMRDAWRQDPALLADLAAAHRGAGRPDLAEALSVDAAGAVRE